MIDDRGSVYLFFGCEARDQREADAAPLAAERYFAAPRHEQIEMMNNSRTALRAAVEAMAATSGLQTSS